MSGNSPVRTGSSKNKQEIVLRLHAQQARAHELRHLSKPFWAAIVIGIASLTSFVVFLAYSLDRNSIEASEQVFASVVSDRAENLSGITLEYGYWDDAVDNLVDRVDNEWVSNTLVDYIFDEHEVVGVHLLDGSGETKLHVVEGKLADVNLENHYGSNIWKLVENARKTPQNKKPNPTTSFLGSPNSLYLASAVVMTTYTTEEDISTDHVLVFTVSLNQNWLNKVSEQYRMPGLSVSTQPAGHWQAALPIRTVDEEQLGSFVWNPVLPGQRLLPFLVLGMLLVFLALFISVRLFFRRATEVVDALEEAKIEADLAREMLSNQARSDPLTGLGNRRLLDEKITDLENVTDQRIHALFYLDLDRFKEINDTYGHGAGDNVLRTVASELEALIEDNDCVFRIGGDEFVILFESAAQEGVLSFGRVVLERLGQPFEIDGSSYRFGVSIGVAFSAKPSELLRQADVALYSAKRQGRGQMVVYSSELLELTTLPAGGSA